MNCENCKKYEDCKNGSGLVWPCGAYVPKFELNCVKCHYMHPNNGNCTAVGGFCTSVPAAYCPLIPELRVRAEAAEKNASKSSSMACGHWIHFSKSDMCSKCGYRTGKYEQGKNFCPNCGADMRGVHND